MQNSIVDTGLSKKTNTSRQRVILYLAFLSSRDCQSICSRFAKAEKLAFQLCRLWFDEIYTPGTRYIDGLKGTRSEVEADEFWSDFTEEERMALERFHRFLELRIDMLPADAKEREIFPQNDLWISVTRDASHVLEALAVDVDRLERDLMWIVRTTVLDQLQ